MRRFVAFPLLAACAQDPDDTLLESDDSSDTVEPVPICDDGLPRVPFLAGAGTDYGQRAGDFTVETSSGPWTLSENWTGCDSILFLGVDPDGETGLLLQGRAKKLFGGSPKNVHIFFLADVAEIDLEAALASIRDVVETGIGQQSEEDQVWWDEHVHFVTTRAEASGGWVGDLLGAYAFPMFGIDRAGAIREIGYLADPLTGWETWEWYFLGYEADRYNFEANRQARLDAENATVVRLFDQVLVSDPGWAGVSSVATVELPDAATMAGFDRLEVDYTLDCGGPWYEACPAWDYINWVYLCDNDDPSTTEDESTQCTELARIITAYWQGGRWLMDASHMLALLQDGGTHTFRTYSQQPYTATIELRLYDSGSGTRARSLLPLWSGGDWKSTYDDGHPPIAFTPPDGTRRVKLVTIVTGHGFGSDSENCAEFCNHQHEFRVNDGAPLLEEFSVAGSSHGCAEQVATSGVVPNQAGTWIYGRGGWCPGLGVEPWVADVTTDVRLGEENTITYRGLFGGQPLSSYPSDAFAGNIVMTSWLVYEQ